jgi:hypothetical protein
VASFTDYSGGTYLPGAPSGQPVVETPTLGGPYANPFDPGAYGGISVPSPTYSAPYQVGSGYNYAEYGGQTYRYDADMNWLGPVTPETPGRPAGGIPAVNFPGTGAFLSTRPPTAGGGGGMFAQGPGRYSQSPAAILGGQLGHSVDPGGYTWGGDTRIGTSGGQDPTQTVSVGQGGPTRYYGGGGPGISPTPGQVTIGEGFHGYDPSEPHAGDKLAPQTQYQRTYQRAMMGAGLTSRQFLSGHPEVAGFISLITPHEQNINASTSFGSWNIGPQQPLPFKPSVAPPRRDPSAAIVTHAARRLTQAQGGPIEGGSGTRDDVPFMGMAGEWVLNKTGVGVLGEHAIREANQGRAVAHYHMGGLIQLLPGMTNLAAIPHFQSGGQMQQDGLAFLHQGENVLPAGAVGSSDNHVENHTEISITVHQDGSRNTRISGLDDFDARDLARTVEAVVDKKLGDAQRFGGQLYSSRSRGA